MEKFIDELVLSPKILWKTNMRVRTLKKRV